MSQPVGYLALVLHAHLPFIRHPEYPDFLEEDWFFEAVTETYVPLLSRFDQLRREGVRFRVTMTVTPPLATMLDDSLLRQRLARYIDTRLVLLEKEVKNNRGTHLKSVARHYFQEFSTAKHFIFEQYHGRLLDAFRELQDAG